MSTEQRLDRLYPGLSAQERALLLLQAYKAHEPPDRLIYETCPSAQNAAFDRLIRLMNALNVELATVLIILREQVAKTDLKYGWLMTAMIWGLETQVLADEVLVHIKDRKQRSAVRRLRARAPGKLRVPLDLTDPGDEERGLFDAGYGDELVRGLLIGINQDVRQHWCELRAVEIAVDEAAGEFAGEDPLQPETRDLLDEGLRGCTTLRDRVAPYVEIELAEPTDEVVAQVRLLIEHAAAPVRTR